MPHWLVFVLSVVAAQAVVPDGFFIRNRLSGKCIDVVGAPGGNGANIQLAPCEYSGFNANGSPTDQLWYFADNGFIVNEVSGSCIDVEGTPAESNSDNVHLAICEYSGVYPGNDSPTDQRWSFVKHGFIRNQLSGKCLDVAGAPGEAYGDNIQLYDCETTGKDPDNGSPTDQEWEIISKSWAAALSAATPPPAAGTVGLIAVAIVASSCVMVALVAVTAMKKVGPWNSVRQHALLG